METSTVDFETAAIASRPHYPPKPVGAAIRWPSGEKEYLAWGHPEGNNCDLTTARSKIKEAYSADRTIFYHGAFDMDVAECHLGLKAPKRFEDPLFMAFLDDPYALELDLKSVAANKLGMAPDEQNELKDWIIGNIPAARKKPSSWGEHIDKAPGKLVGRYAIGDVDRTYKLFKHYSPIIEKRGMTEAYERELKCVPITLEMERSGIRVDVKRLRVAGHKFEDLDRRLLRRIAKKLRLDPKNLKSDENPKGFNLNSGAQLADALMRAGKLDTIKRTPTGKVSTKIENLKAGCNDVELLNLISVHSAVNKTVSSFITPWLAQCAITGDRLLPKFNQVRGYDEGGGGARSGRYSSSDPNLQNITANILDSKNREVLELMQKLLRQELDYDFIGLRDFLIPDEDTVMVCVDYNQQELRILAHFEQGVLMRAYLENPDLDVHEFCRELVKDITGLDVPRKSIKTTVFGLIYGMGVNKLALGLGGDMKMAKQIRDSVLEALPGIGKLMRDFKRMANRNEPLRTWGGREYYCEEPKYVKKFKRWMTFEYRLLNYAIQPSAADCTKQGMINVHEQVPEARIAVQVHDELISMVPRVKNFNKYGQRIKAAMCDVKMNVPMRAEAKYSEFSWARAA